LDEVGVSFDKLRDYLPAMGRLMEREEPDVHPKLTRETLHAKHPVVILPGTDGQGRRGVGQGVAVHSASRK
jgi:hypothetical protein